MVKTRELAKWYLTLHLLLLLGYGPINFSHASYQTGLNLKWETDMDTNWVFHNSSLKVKCTVEDPPQNGLTWELLTRKRSYKWSVAKSEESDGTQEILTRYSTIMPRMKLEWIESDKTMISSLQVKSSEVTDDAVVTCKVGNSSMKTPTLKIFSPPQKPRISVQYTRRPHFVTNDKYLKTYCFAVLGSARLLTWTVNAVDQENSLNVSISSSGKTDGEKRELPSGVQLVSRPVRMTVDKLPVVTSILYLKITPGLDQSNLSCRTHHVDDYIRRMNLASAFVESDICPLHVRYLRGNVKIAATRSKPRFADLGHGHRMSVRCDAYVATNGSISIATFNKRKEYMSLYKVNMTGHVIPRIKGSTKFEFLTMASNWGLYGDPRPRIITIMTFMVPEHNMSHFRAACFSYDATTIVRELEGDNPYMAVLVFREASKSFHARHATKLFLFPYVMCMFLMAGFTMFGGLVGNIDDYLFGEDMSGTEQSDEWKWPVPHSQSE